MAMIDGFAHEALVYTDDDDFLRGVAPFVREGIAAGDAVLCALPVERIWLLRDALGPESERVAWADMGELGRNPARIIPAWRDFLARHPDRACRGVGEPVWPGRGGDEVVECQRHEHLLNTAFDGGRPWRLLCPYDGVGLDPEVVAGAHRTHPTVGGAASEHYLDLDPLAAPFPPVVEAAVAFPFAADDLRALRAFVAHHAALHGLPPERVADLVLAANELATNSIRHAGGAGTLRVWSAGWSVVCEVRDAGRVTDPLVGRWAPSPRTVGGRGLWLANHLCDLVQLWSGDGGTVARLHLRA